MFLLYRDKGLCVIPLGKDGIPPVKWKQFQSDFPTEQEAANWDKCGFDYGLMCGLVSGLVCLDIDTDDPAVIAQVEAIAGISPVKKIGSKGFTAFYAYGGEKTSRWGQVELLSDKHMTTIPPSRHRSKDVYYKWVGAELGAVALPPLPANFCAIMDLLYPRPVRQYTPRPFLTSEVIDMGEAQAMLTFVSSDTARDEWIKIGMALKAEFGDTACNLWHEWSSLSPRYKAQDATSAWRSFHGEGITIATLAWMAHEAGYRKEPSPSPLPVKIEISGIVSTIADWITQTAIRPQPVLSLAAALTFMGMVKGHRVRGATNLRTNIMALSIAPTASGKEHPQYCIDSLAAACGLSAHIMGRPTSGTGLLTGLHKAGAIGLLPVDEMGRFLGNIAMKNAGGFQREITDYMVELFSCASRVFRGRQYADERANPQMQLQQPLFCCLGSSVAEKLQQACTASEVIDGFLNRWLVFTSGIRPAKQKGKRGTAAPDALVSLVKAWMDANPLKKDVYGNPDPMEMRFTPEAWDILQEFESRMMQKLETDPYPVNQLYARAGEHAEKIAMVLCDGDLIGIGEINAAIGIVEQSNLNICAFAGSISNSQHESDLLYVLDIVRNAGQLTRRELTRRTQKLNQKSRGDIITQLLESDRIEEFALSKTSVLRFLA